MSEQLEPIAAPPPPTPRLRWLWLLLSIVFLAYFAIGFSALEWPKPGEPVSVTNERTELKSLLKFRLISENLQKQAEQSGAASIPGANPDQNLITLERRLEPIAQNSDEAAALLLTAQSVRGAERSSVALDRLLLSESEQSIVLGEAFSGILHDAAQIEGDSIEARAARYLVEHPEAETVPISALGIQANPALLITAILLLAGAFLGGIVLFLVYLVLKLTGKLPNAGYQEDLSPPETDRHAGRFFVYLGFFILLMLFVEIVGQAAQINSTWLNVGLMAVMVAMAPFFGTMPIRGQSFSAKRLLGRTKGLPGLVLWGIAGFAANFPVAMAMMLPLFPFRESLPVPRHQAIEELLSNSGAGQVFALFFVAAVAAPIVEEIMFRGVLTPALIKVLRSPAVGIIVGGVMFSIIHPQGPLLWPSLAMIGISSAILARQTGSLIPSIVLHACHNGTILILNLAINT